MIYIIEGAELKWVLDKVDEAVSIIEPFKTIHKDYSYSINISQHKSKWKAKIHVKYGKKDRDSSQEFIEPPEIL
jgi:hypothetical protein